MIDVLSDVLSAVRFRSAVYFQSDFATPWGMAMDSGPVAQFHLVVRGQCWLERGDGSDPVPLSGDDVVVFPRGDSHRLADAPGQSCVPGTAVLSAINQNAPLFQEGPAKTTLVCGHFEFDRSLHHPLIEQLPALIHVRGAENYGCSWLDTAVSLLIAETKNDAPGRSVVVNRLAEILFIQVLRAYWQQPEAAVGYWTALNDRPINQALQLLHEQPQASWTLAEIARRVGLSRAAFANRFRDLVGVPPMHYLTSWRMQKAREMLRDSSLPLFVIANRVGYASEAAFNRAFKREFQQNPGAMRKALTAVR